VFKINPDGSGYTVLENFDDTDGAQPGAGLMLSGRVLYGVTVNGGSWGVGTLFKVDTNGTGYSVLKNFTGSPQRSNPYAALTLSGSVLYGTTFEGGRLGYGTLFKVNTDGSGYTLLKDFAHQDGERPYATLTLSSGVLFGTTSPRHIP
jgi:uncharacterized repeat protein (TIGR03803 family)